MEIQPITYRGRTVAACTRRRFFVCDELERRPSSDPLLTFVLAICLHAGQLANGRLPRPYSDHAAPRHAPATLIPDELLDRPAPDIPGQDPSASLAHFI